ncbi:MAG: hypothetical protein AAF413_03420 [Patescibacteria group bacterium]
MAIKTIDSFSGARRLKRVQAPKAVYTAFGDIEHDPDVVHFRDQLGSWRPVHPMAAVIGLLRDGQPMRQTVFFDIQQSHWSAIETTTAEMIEELRNHNRTRRIVSIGSRALRGVFHHTGSELAAYENVWSSIIGSSGVNTFGGIVISKDVKSGVDYVDIYCHRRVGAEALSHVKGMTERGPGINDRLLRTSLYKRMLSRRGLRPITQEEVYAMLVTYAGLQQAQELDMPLHVH